MAPILQGHAKFVIPLCSEYTIVGSVITRFFEFDDLEEVSRELALRGQVGSEGPEA